MFAVLLFVSCTNQLAPVKTTPILNTYPTSKSINDAWDSALQFFKDKQIELQYADKSNGYIITGPVKISWKLKQSEEKLSPSGAEVMILKEGDNDILKGKIVTARYKVKISQTDGKTILVPSIEDIRIVEHSYDKQTTTAICKSTGSFEKNFVNLMN